MTTKYATPFKGETLNDKKERLIRGMNFLVKRNPKKYRMVTDGTGNLILEEVCFHWRHGNILYNPVQTIKIHSEPRNVTSRIGF